MKPFLELRKKSNGHLILALHFEELFSWPKYLLLSGVNPIVKSLTVIFETLDEVSRHHTALFLIAALGLGFGMSLPIFASPDLSWADTEEISMTQADCSVKQLSFYRFQSAVTVLSADRSSLIPNRSVAYQLSTQPLIIQGNWHSELSEILEQLTLGDEITILATNDGRYAYGVVEIREVKSTELPNLVHPGSQQLLLVVPTNVTQQSLLVVVAQRQTTSL